MGSVGMFYAYHNGGCTFALDNSNSKSIEVLASYIDAENQPAMILCSYGKGNAILSGIHFEADQLLLRNTTSDEKPVLDSIASDVELTADIRKKFLDSIF